MISMVPEQEWGTNSRTILLFSHILRGRIPARAAVTKYHRLEPRKPQKIIVLQFWRLEPQDQNASKCGFLWGLSPLLVDGHLLHFSTWSLPCVSASWCLLIRTPSIRLGPPWWSHLTLVNPLEKERATHSGILAWKILWTEEPGGW